MTALARSLLHKPTLIREADMRSLTLGVLAVVGLFQISSSLPVAAQIGLAGQVTSAEEGPMEGVLVSAKRAGSTITITVASDLQGRYTFPAAKLEPGQYALRIRATGYDLEAPTAIDLAADKPATAD